MTISGAQMKTSDTWENLYERASAAGHLEPDLVLGAGSQARLSHPRESEKQALARANRWVESLEVECLVAETARSLTHTGAQNAKL